MRILLAGRISWRALFPAACATGVLYVAMQTVFSLVFSAMVISDEHTYGPIGTIFALLSYLIAIGVVVILGAVAGRAWHERSPGTSKTSQLPPGLPSSVATGCACPGVEQFASAACSGWQKRVLDGRFDLGASVRSVKPGEAAPAVPGYGYRTDGQV